MVGTPFAVSESLEPRNSRQGLSLIDHRNRYPDHPMPRQSPPSFPSFSVGEGAVGVQLMAGDGYFDGYGGNTRPVLERSKISSKGCAEERGRTSGTQSREARCGQAI